jgi:hypothetical protein
MRATVQARAHQPVTGCAVERWDAHLMGFLPRIDACLSASPGTRRVIYAGDGGDGFLVRMQDDTGAYADCRLGPDGPRVAPRDETRRYASEGDAIFVRAPGENPGGECFEAPEVRDESGALLGWMDDPLGC